MDMSSPDAASHSDSASQSGSASQSDAVSQSEADDCNSRYGVVTGLRAASIFSSLSALFLSVTYSDMRIICEDRNFMTHRAVVCTQSSFFKKALEDALKAGCQREHGIIGRLTYSLEQEGKPTDVLFPDVDSAVLERFLQFLYTGNYDEENSQTSGQPSHAALVTVREVSENLKTSPCTVDID